MKVLRFAISLPLVATKAWKLVKDGEVDDLLSLDSCSTHPCLLEDGWAPKPDFHKITGKTNHECCRPTCRRWTCGKGYKKHADYLDNVASNDRECCDKLCSAVQCNATHTVPESKMQTLGALAEECCEPKCSQHSCFGSWATDPSKLNQAGKTNEACCLPSCAAYVCHKSEGFQHVPGRHDAPQPATDAQSYCCEKTCGFYKDQCGEHMGVDVSDKVKMATAVTDSNFKAKCCEPKCSSVTCKAKHYYDPTYRDYLLSKVPVGSNCCIGTCETYSCSTGWVSNPDVANFVLANLRNEDCCLPTCALHNCGEGWFNSTNKGKLMKVSSSNSVCCETSCKDFKCPKGSSRRPSAKTISATGSAACCEPHLCADFRENKDEVEFCNAVKDEATCKKSYDVLDASRSTARKGSIAPCTWNAEMSLCVDDSHKLTSCDPLK